jgi:RimJ/RimL family protein N-acetyltransferase
MADRHRIDLAELVTTALTETTTTALPSDWHGDFTLDRAQRWIVERDAESATLLAVERATDDAIGLVILIEMAGEQPPTIDLRIGYVIAESEWGRGLASELVGGLAEWARSKEPIETISGGVAEDNHSSARVLTRNGFSAAPDPPHGDMIYVLRLDS